VTDVEIELFNAQATSGGTGPGQVTVPPDEAQPLVDAGYAQFVAGEGPS
jgi:hypothetical protein